MKNFTIIFRILWLIAIIMIILTDYYRPQEKIETSPYYNYLLFSTIIFLVILTIISVIRALESRNEWREMIKDGEVEAMEGLSYRKKVEKEIEKIEDE